MTVPRRHPITLSFKSDELERGFRENYARTSIRPVRYAMLLGVVFYAGVFGLVDFFTVPTFVPVLWTIRGGVSLAALGVVAFSYTDTFQSVLQPVVGGVMLLAGWGLVLMLALDPTGSHFYEGPILIILTAYVAVQLRFVTAMVVGWLVVAAYLAVALGLKVAPFVSPVSNVVFVASANVIGMFAGYMLERYARLQYWQSKVINEKRKENARLLQTRSRFFANVSHEFRTPLTLILGPLQDLLQDPDALPENARTSLQRVQRNAERLNRLIDQLLDLARLEVNKWPLRARRAPLDAFLSDLVRTFDPLADRAGIDLGFQSDVDGLTVYFDADKLDKAISNLVLNALKYTPAGGRVRVRLDSLDSESRKDARIQVRDTGPGIPESDLPYVFDRFHRSDDSTLSQSHGTGIGLALAKELVELHGGEINVESDPDFGTTFTVTLPLGDAHLRDDDIARDDASDETVSDETVSDETVSDETVSDVRDAPDLPADASDAVAVDAETDADADVETILVVEDDPDVRAYVRQGLASRYRVVEASDGDTGFERANDVVPDLIVTDVMMPGTDGYAFCRRVKESRVLDHVPVLMLTAKVESDDAVDGFEAGADAYVTKPFNVRELHARVASLLANRRRLRERFSQDTLATPEPITVGEVDVASADERFVEEARSVVEDHVDDEHFNVDAFADAMRMSRRQLQRKLKSVTDRTPSQFIRLIRLGRAKQLVEQNYGTIAQIAYAVGFSSPSYFTKCFRETFGDPPSAFQDDAPPQ